MYEPLRSDLASVVRNLKQRYHNSVDLCFQFGYVESLLTKSCMMDEIMLISGTDKDVSLVAEVQSVLQEDKLAQAEFSRLLDTLITSCELPEMTNLVVTSKLPSTLLQMVPRYLLIDDIMTKILHVFVIPNLEVRGPVKINPRNVGTSPTAPRSATILSFPRMYFA